MPCGGTSDKRKPLNPVEISMLDAYHAGIRKQLLGPVVDQLAVDKTVDAVRLDLGHLGLHLVLFGALELGQLAGPVHAHARTKDLDLVRVHGCMVPDVLAGAWWVYTCVCHEDLGILDSLGLVHAKLFVQDKALVQVRVLQAAAGLFDDLDIIQIGGALEAEDGVDGKVGKVVLVGGQDWFAEC